MELFANGVIGNDFASLCWQMQHCPDRCTLPFPRDDPALCAQDGCFKMIDFPNVEKIRSTKLIVYEFA